MFSFQLGVTAQEEEVSSAELIMISDDVKARLQKLVMISDDLNAQNSRYKKLHKIIGLCTGACL